MRLEPTVPSTRTRASGSAAQSAAAFDGAAQPSFAHRIA